MELGFNPNATIDQKIEGLQSLLTELTNAEAEAGEVAKAQKQADNKLARDQVTAELNKLINEKSVYLKVTIS